MKKQDPYKDLETFNMGTRPAIQPARTSQVQVLFSEDEYQHELFKLMLSQMQYVKRLTEMAYNYKNPVDENVVIGENVGTAVQPIIIQPDYDQTEMYESILYSLPLGCTSATLNIGTNRSIQLYSGAAVTVQQIVSLPYLRILVSPDDKRQLVLTGQPFTSIGYLGLMGHCFEREGSR